jgi:hypothetical protein
LCICFYVPSFVRLSMSVALMLPCVHVGSLRFPCGSLVIHDQGIRKAHEFASGNRYPNHQKMMKTMYWGHLFLSNVWVVFKVFGVSTRNQFMFGFGRTSVDMGWCVAEDRDLSNVPWHFRPFSKGQTCMPKCGGVCHPPTVHMTPKLVGGFSAPTVLPHRRFVRSTFRIWADRKQASNKHHTPHHTTPRNEHQANTTLDFRGVPAGPERVFRHSK